MYICVYCVDGHDMIWYEICHSFKQETVVGFQSLGAGGWYRDFPPFPLHAQGSGTLEPCFPLCLRACVLACLPRCLPLCLPCLPLCLPLCLPPALPLVSHPPSRCLCFHSVSILSPTVSIVTHSVFHVIKVASEQSKTIQISMCPIAQPIFISQSVASCASCQVLLHVGVPVPNSKFRKLHFLSELNSETGRCRSIRSDRSLSTLDDKDTREERTRMSRTLSSTLLQPDFSLLPHVCAGFQEAWNFVSHCVSQLVSQLVSHYVSHCVCLVPHFVFHLVSHLASCCLCFHCVSILKLVSHCVSHSVSHFCFPRCLPDVFHYCSCLPDILSQSQNIFPTKTTVS